VLRQRYPPGWAPIIPVGPYCAPPVPKPKDTDERLEDDRKDGSVCWRCGEWTPLARPNLDDGRFECWSCRANPWRPGLKR